MCTALTDGGAGHGAGAGNRGEAVLSARGSRGPRRVGEWGTRTRECFEGPSVTRQPCLGQNRTFLPGHGCLFWSVWPCPVAPGPGESPNTDCRCSRVWRRRADRCAGGLDRQHGSLGRWLAASRK